LWTGALYKRAPKKQLSSAKVWLSVFFGVAPDLLSFGILFTSYFLRNGLNRPEFLTLEPPDPSLIPNYVSVAYNYTHSLVVFAVIFALVWLLFKKPFIPLSAWALHILIDIPTHTSAFFPTPFLWPLSSFKVSGISWGEPWFLLLNYSAIILVYFIIYVKQKGK
jgi:magnesium-transporting ATPase (P-type)